MSAAHTPGPWTTDPEVGNEGVLGADGALVADCSIFLNPEFGKRTSKINRANAHLIAAAPDLLAALKTARECIAYCRKAHKDAQSGEGFPVEMILDAAIAKAEGRTP
jgi:hypothetical protein